MIRDSFKITFSSANEIDFLLVLLLPSTLLPSCPESRVVVDHFRFLSLLTLLRLSSTLTSAIFVSHRLSFALLSLLFPFTAIVPLLTTSLAISISTSISHNIMYTHCAIFLLAFSFLYIFFFFFFLFCCCCCLLSLSLSLSLA